MGFPATWHSVVTVDMERYRCGRIGLSRSAPRGARIPARVRAFPFRIAQRSAADIAPDRRQVDRCRTISIRKEPLRPARTLTPPFDPFSVPVDRSFTRADTCRQRLRPAPATGSSGDGHLVPNAAIQVEAVAIGLAGPSVSDVAVEGMAVVGRLYRAARACDCA
jgi:hypothetical protein